jgi:hypothetical protein
VILKPSSQGAGEDNGAHGEDEGETNDNQERCRRHWRTSVSGDRNAATPGRECNYGAGRVAGSSFLFQGRLSTVGMQLAGAAIDGLREGFEPLTPILSRGERGKYDMRLRRITAEGGSATRGGSQGRAF